MIDPFLLSRISLQFNDKSDDLLGELSAAARTPDGSLWLGSDEYLSLERLSPLGNMIYGQHKSFFLGDFLELFNNEDEVDVEGMDYSQSYLWFTGSHSYKRKKTKGKDEEKAIARLSEITTDANRYLLGRIPCVNGELHKTCSDPAEPDKILTAACLKKTEQGNILTDALREDDHLGPIITSLLPSKDNGLDVEGLAVRGDRIFLGLRGPVLRGWAIILELELAEAEPGVLTLKPIGKGDRPYRKHFVQLNGLGVRELCLYKEDLIILAGPTMELEGEMQVFRLHDLQERDDDSLTYSDDDDLTALFDLPFTIGSDHAEGLALIPCLGYDNALMIVYDAPNPIRRIQKDTILMDVFHLPF
ncbi:MAG: DUF3616 domain-containing protein [Synechococcales bacterium]|nr:DUF3616 domain-containing protein [Synechococcales bacterium]